MSIAAVLLLYGLMVLVFGPSLLRRLTFDGNAPRFGVAAWLTAIVSVLTTWFTAAILFVVDITGHWYRGTFAVSCLAKLRGVVLGDAGLEPQVGMLTLAAGGAVALAVVGVRLARTLGRLRRGANDHAEAVRLVGKPTGVENVIVVDAPEAAAYCVYGRPPTIVVTSAAVAALDERQLGAVLAHERAHLTGHHPNVVAALRSLATVFPRLPLMTEGAAEVSRLLEMCADDAATRDQGRNALLSGLITLAGVAPSGALGAADVAVLTRAKRLTAPAARRARVRTAVHLSSAMTIMVAGPLITVVVAISGALMCGP